MRHYGQFCPLAKALDVVGDRWTLLIVRELSGRPCRYTDLRDGLPGIATNLLADRLRHLEAVDVVRREDPRPPVATPVFRLTERGAALRPAVEALAVWGGGFVREAAGDAEFRTRRRVIPVEALLIDGRPDEPAVTLALRTGDEPLTVEVGGGRVSARPGEVHGDPDLVITGPPKPILAILAGRLPPAVAANLGVRLDGDLDVLARAGLGAPE